MAPYAKTLILGTAQWGWTVSKQEAFQLLDAWLLAGHRHLDCATNYPINRHPADFRAAEKILEAYILAHGLSDLDITMKIGSLDNLRSPEVNLAPSFVQMISEEYLRIFGNNLKCVMFHWDNRDRLAEIEESLYALKRLKEAFGLRPGLSGIAHPEVYAEANKAFGLSFDIQLKHNVLQSDFGRWMLDIGQGNVNTQHSTLNTQPSNVSRYYAYGINAGGVKLETPYPAGSTFLARGGQVEKALPVLEKINALIPAWNTAFVRPPVKTMNHIGLIFAGWHPGLSGLLLGVSSVTQLRETLDYWQNFEVFDYSDVFSALNKIHLPA